MEQDYKSAGLDAKQIAMLRYAEKLTRRPGEMARDDVDALRTAGFEDADILAIAEVTAYYAYVNRIADGLGVAVEPWVEGAEAPPLTPPTPQCSTRRG